MKKTLPRNFAALLTFLALGNIGISAPVSSQVNTIGNCLSDQLTNLDDRITQADVVAKAIVRACRSTILKNVQRQYPSSLPMSQKVTASRLDAGFEADALELVLKNRTRANNSAKSDAIVPTYNLGDVFSAGSARFRLFQEVQTSRECLYIDETSNRKELITVVPSKQNRVVSSIVTTYPGDKTTCRSSIESSLRDRGLFDVRQELKQAEIKAQYSSLATGEVSPLFRGEVVVFYKGEKGNTAFTAGCFVRGTRLERVFAESDSRDSEDAIRETIDKYVDKRETKVNCGQP